MLGDATTPGLFVALLAARSDVAIVGAVEVAVTDIAAAAALVAG